MYKKFSFLIYIGFDYTGNIAFVRYIGYIGCAENRLSVGNI